ncbi:MAG: squalene/phytoene synthase family protein, partial [Rhodospirillaceae bacterium]
MIGPANAKPDTDSALPETDPAVHARLRQGDRERYLCALTAPADRRVGLLALHDFNLEVARVRETVSDPMVGQLRLKWWHDALAAIAAGDPPAHPVATALAAAVGRHGLDTAALQALVEVRAANLGPMPPADTAALKAYVAATAGVVATVGLDVL